mmetsp:Transcript_8025/g.17942  ORF Transcript_8025/g.17942 Transcript_8025/m.17942 type:complete len:201 (-) Transcript_8025:1180-1782(-)
MQRCSVRANRCLRLSRDIFGAACGDSRRENGASSRTAEAPWGPYSGQILGDCGTYFELFDVHHHDRGGAPGCRHGLHYDACCHGPTHLLIVDLLGADQVQLPLASLDALCRDWSSPLGDSHPLRETRDFLQPGIAVDRRTDALQFRSRNQELCEGRVEVYRSRAWEGAESAQVRLVVDVDRVRPRRRQALRGSRCGCQWV